MSSIALDSAVDEPIEGIPYDLEDQLFVLKTPFADPRAALTEEHKAKLTALANDTHMRAVLGWVRAIRKIRAAKLALRLYPCSDEEL